MLVESLSTPSSNNQGSAYLSCSNLAAVLAFVCDPKLCRCFFAGAAPSTGESEPAGKNSGDFERSGPPELGSLPLSFGLKSLITVNPELDVMFREAASVLVEVDAEIDAKADEADGGGPFPFH